MRHTNRWIALALAALLLLAACSSERGDDDDAVADDPASEEETSSEEVTFGDMASPCGEGDASGATDQGVTDDAIKIGYGDDAGFTNSPGLNHEVSDAVKAFVAWCNDQGGINGRRIEATYYDAKITEVNNAMTQACASEFALVGQGWSLDASQEETRRGCGLPSIPSFAVSPQHANGPDKFESLPVPGDFVARPHAFQLAELFPEKIKKARTLYANYSATIDNEEKVIRGFTDAGYEFECRVQYNILGEPDWRPLVQRLKDCGAEIVYWSGSPAPNMQNALTAAAQLEYEPIWFGDPNIYDLRFASWNTDGFGDNVYFRSAAVPLHEDEESKAVRDYIDIVEADGGDVGLLGQQAAGSFLLWATAAKACGSELTRACLVEELRGITAWTAGGLHAESNPGENEPPYCGALLKMTGTAFERIAPEEPGTFDCDDSYGYQLTEGGLLERANLDENRISQL